MILLCLTILLYVYVIGVRVLLLNFIFRGYNVTITTFSDGKKTNLQGSKKIWALVFMCLLWPIILIKNLFE